MARCHWTLIIIIALALAGAQQTTRAQDTEPPAPPPAPIKDTVSVVYRLSDLGTDPGMAKWVADTMYQVIDAPWGDIYGTVITYHAPSRIMVVRHTPAVQAKVKALLADLKGATREEPGTLQLRKAPVMQAQYTQAVPQKAPQTTGAGYPVPAPEKQPKHLFHLVIRYEGDGLPEGAVESMVKQLSDASTDKGEGQNKKAEPAKGPSLGQLLHFIVRYEGDGIVDANVVALMKELYRAQQEPSRVSPIAGGVFGGALGTGVGAMSSDNGWARKVPATDGPQGVNPVPGYVNQPQYTPASQPSSYGASPAVPVQPYPSSGSTSTPYGSEPLRPGTSSSRRQPTPSSNPAQGYEVLPAPTPVR